MTDHKIEFKGGCLTSSINLFCLLESLGDDDAQQLAESLACFDPIIKEVTYQILTGWTTGSSHAARACQSEAIPHNALDAAVREVARRSSEIAAKEIGRLEDSLRRKDQEICDLRSELRQRNER